MSEAEKKSTEQSEPAVRESEKSDALDLGVPMLPGDGSERVGPEDALGEGPKRGDYRDRLGDSSYRPHTTEVIPDAKPGEPRVRVVPQAPRTEDIGDDAGKKGGVETAK